MKKYNIQTFDGLTYGAIYINFSRIGNSFELEYISELTSISIKDDFPFMALKKIRLELENLNIKLLCNGSRTNVYPSGFSLTSIKAYELIIGVPATRLLNIFEPYEIIDNIGTVLQQEEFRLKWLDSLK